MVLFKCTTPGRARSKKNSKQIFRGKNGRPFITASKEYKAWAIYASMFINRAKSNPTITDPCTLIVNAYYKNYQHQQDCDNLLASIQDVLQDCEIIKNDSLFHKVICQKHYDSNNIERIEIEIVKE